MRSRARIRAAPSQASTQTQRISGRTSQKPPGRTPPQGPFRSSLGQFIGHDMPVELSTHWPHILQSKISPLIALSARATGRSILTASGGSEEAIEGYRGHGLFTYQVLDAINVADGDASGTVEVTELAAYVYAQVSELSLKIFKRRQVPQMKIVANYPLTRQARILPEHQSPVAQATPNFQVAQNAQLKVQPSGASTVVRSLSAKAEVSVLESRNGWFLIASGGKPLGWVAERDLTPVK